MLETTHTSRVDFSGSKMADAFKAAKLTGYDPRFGDPNFLTSFGAGVISEMDDEVQAQAFRDHGVHVQGMDSILISDGNKLRRQSVAFRLDETHGRKASLFTPKEAYTPSLVAAHMQRMGYRPASLLELLSFMAQVDGNFVGAVVPYAGKSISNNGVPWGILLNKPIPGGIAKPIRVLRLWDRPYFKSDKPAGFVFFLGVQR